MDVAQIRKTRRARGLTQTRLAKLVGVHPLTVSRWERGLLKPSGHPLAILELLASSAKRRAAESELEDLAGVLNQSLIDVGEVDGMQISASNVFRGKVVTLDEGPVTSRIVIEIAPRVRITSLITTASAKRLRLKVGKRAVAIIKATEVIVGAP